MSKHPVHLYIGKDQHIYFVGTKFHVWKVISEIISGASEEEIHDLYPDLPRGCYRSAEVYYSVHKEEMDEVIRASLGRTITKKAASG